MKMQEGAWELLPFFVLFCARRASDFHAWSSLRKIVQVLADNSHAFDARRQTRHVEPLIQAAGGPAGPETAS